MTEILALPRWNVAGTTLSAWTEALSAQGLDVVLTRESTGVSWVDVAALGLRGYVVTRGAEVEAINFELSAPDTSPARDALARAAAALSWELDEDSEEEEEDEDEG